MEEGGEVDLEGEVETVTIHQTTGNPRSKQSATGSAEVRSNSVLFQKGGEANDRGAGETNRASIVRKEGREGSCIIQEIGKAVGAVDGTRGLAHDAQWEMMG